MRGAAATLALTALVACSSGNDDTKQATKTRRATTTTVLSPSSTEASTTTSKSVKPTTTKQARSRYRASAPLQPADLAFIVANGDVFSADVVLADSKTGARQLIFNGDAELHASSATWSPDGKYLAIQAFGPGGKHFADGTRNVVGLQVAILDMATGAITISSDHNAVSDYPLLWSPNSRYVAYLLDEQNGGGPRVMVIDAAKGTEAALTASGNFAWLADSSGVVASTAGCGDCDRYYPMQIAYLDGRAPRVMADSTESSPGNDEPYLPYFDRPPRTGVSADGAFMFVRRNIHVNGPRSLVANIASSRFAELPADSRLEGWLGTTHTMLLAGNGDYLVVNPDACAPRPAKSACGATIKLDGSSGCESAISPDATMVLDGYCGTPFRNQRYGVLYWSLIPTNGTKARKLLDTGTERRVDVNGAWLADGSAVVIPGPDGEYKVVNLKGEIIQPLGAASSVVARPRTT
jgi:hypothetical protein